MSVEVTTSVVNRGASLIRRVPGDILASAITPFPFPRTVWMAQREFSERLDLVPFCDNGVGE